MPFILVTVLIDMVSIGLIVPVLPLIVGRFTASPAEQTFWFGAVTFTFGVANFFGSPILGALSDRYANLLSALASADRIFARLEAAFGRDRSLSDAYLELSRFNWPPAGTRDYC